jgi:hypothetical protein
MGAVGQQGGSCLACGYLRRDVAVGDGGGSTALGRHLSDLLHPDMTGVGQVRWASVVGGGAMAANSVGGFVRCMYGVIALAHGRAKSIFLEQVRFGAPLRAGEVSQFTWIRHPSPWHDAHPQSSSSGDGGQGRAGPDMTGLWRRLHSTCTGVRATGPIESWLCCVVLCRVVSGGFVL